MLLQYLRELQALDVITGCGTGCQDFESELLDVEEFVWFKSIFCSFT